LAEELVKITPGTFDKKIIYGFAGSDSIDAAIKVSRAYTGRSKIILSLSLFLIKLSQ